MTSFGPSEFRDLGQVLDSPFFNQREDLRRLFPFLQNRFQEASPPSREEAYAIAYPGQAYDDARLRHLFSFLYKQCEQVLIERELGHDPLLRNTLLLRALNGRKAEKPYRHTLNARRRMVEKSGLRNTDLHLHQLETLRMELNRSDIRTEKLQGQFQTLSREIDVFYILHKLQLACAALTHQRMFKVEYELGMLEEVLAHVEQGGFLALPEVAICYNCYRMLSEPQDDSHFHRLKAQMPQTSTLFEQKETRTFYTHLINFCISRINRGEAAYLREVFEIYQLALEAGVLLDEGKLSPYTYKNIVSASIKLGEYAWTGVFIDEYAASLPNEVRKDYQSYNLARLHLANENHREVVKILNRIYIQDPFTHLDGRIILIKANYELGEFKQIEYLLNNLKHHLRRKEFLTYHKKNYHAFARLTRRLLDLAPYKKKAREKLKLEIENAEWLTEREWLLAKIGEFP